MRTQQAVWFPVFLVVLLMGGASVAQDMRSDTLKTCSPVTRCGDGICQWYMGERPETCVDCVSAPVSVGAEITVGPLLPFDQSHGDLWLSTWGPDDDLYVAWGDGCGPGFGWVPELYTDCGIARMHGEVPGLSCPLTPDGCVLVRDAPAGSPDGLNDKPGSLLYVNNRLYLAGYQPLDRPDEGYIAVSDDAGYTWTKIPGSPWVKDPDEPSRSVFRCLMFINMGKHYELNTDGYVYAFGIGWSWDWCVAGRSQVHLTRVPIDGIVDYSAYEYLSGYAGAEPVWSTDETQAIPVPGIRTAMISSSIYHEGTGRFLLLTSESLFESPHPWGPWIAVARLLSWGDNPDWRGGYMPALITKNAGDDFVWFAYAGQDRVIPYEMHLGRIDLDVSERDQTQEPSQPFDTLTPHAGTIGGVCGETPKLAFTGSETHGKLPRILTVPAEYPDIRSAVENAQSGDTILLQQGVFNGPGNRGIDIRGVRDLHIRSESGAGSCMIDCEHQSYAFRLETTADSTITISGITIVNAYAVGSGGALCINESKPVIRDCVIRCCAANFQGGGAVCYESGAIFERCSFELNSSGGVGGGLSVLGRSHVRLDSCRFTGNSSLHGGGGIFCESAEIDAVHCILDNNEAEYGGGLCFFTTYYSSVANCLFRENRASSRGGGLFLDNAYAQPPGGGTYSLKIDHCTFTENEASLIGGGVFAERALFCTFEMDNSIVWNNQAASGRNVGLRGDDLARLNVAFSDVDTSAGSIETGPGWTIVWGQGILSQDPLFVAGPENSLRLSHQETGQSATSPCVDAASAAAADTCFGSDCLTMYTTRLDEIPDYGTADMGFHYETAMPAIPVLSRAGIAMLVLAFSAILSLLYFITKSRL